MKPSPLTARSLRRGVASTVARSAASAGGMGVGGGAPTFVHTQGNLLPNGPKPSGSAAPTGAARAPQARPKKYAPRHPLGRGSKKGWRRWIKDVAAELESRGALDLAHNLRSCGSMARVRECDACGDACASVEVRASCGHRVCPWCARISARSKVALVSGALTRVEGYQRAQLPAAIARVDGERLAALAAVDHWTRLAAVARAAGRVEVADRHDSRARAAAARAATSRRETKAIGELHRWRWKLVTISPPWRPLDPVAYTPEGLRARVAACVEAWRRAWDAGARAGGLAAATMRVELSSRGHVHVHILYRGPYVPQAWWARVCGCIVDVRAVDDGGVTEALKYALKMPTPSRSEWIGGDSRDAPHPRLAAAWLLATRRVQLLRHFGVMRDAIAAEEAAPAASPEDRADACGCASCGADLSAVPVRLVPTDQVARYLGPRWGAAAGQDVWGRPLPKRLQITQAPW